MGFESRAISARVTKQIVTIFSKTCDKRFYCTFQVFNIRYPEMYKVQGAKCAISKLMYGLSECTDDNHSLKARDLSSRTHGRTIH